MSKATAAAASVGGLLLAIVGGVGFLALIVATLLNTYSGGLLVWVGLPVLFVAGVSATVYGLARLLGEVSDLADGSLESVSDLKRADGVKQLRKLYNRID